MRQNGQRSNVRFPYGSSGMKKGGSVKKQVKASANESYGKFGSKAKKSGKINK